MRVPPSAFRLPPSAQPPSAQPPAPSPQPPRRGISLTEVLIAMGILTLGLLGVAAVFPVGSWNMQKADIANNGSAIAQSVMNDLVARGMLNPRAWYVMTPWTGSNYPAPANVVFPSDGKLAPAGTPKAGTFTRPFALTLNEALSQPTAATDRTLIAKQFGNAYVIDPLGVSVMAFQNANFAAPAPGAVGPAALFPATAYYDFTNYMTWGGPGWSAWSGGKSANNGGYLWPIRRATFRQSSSGWQMDPTMASHYFQGSDDLVADLPQRDDRPAAQSWDYIDSNNNGRADVGEPPTARKWTGDYSWIVTVVPTTNAARDAMASNPEGFAYDVSVVVFYKRPLPESADTSLQPLLTSGGYKSFDSGMGANERAVNASVISSGPSGGELLLTDWGDFYDASGIRKYNAFDGLRTGQWIMLCGPHPNSNVDNTTNPPTGEPRFVLNWYQVLSVDAEGKGVVDPQTNNPFDPNTQRVVAIRGPEWPWQPTSTSTNVANNLCVAICKGAVAVHTKTIRLESPASSPVAFGASGSNTSSPSPFTFF